MHAVVLGEIADAEVLPVAGEIHEGEGALVERAQEPRRSTAMLDIRPTLSARRRHEEAVALGDVADQLRREGVAGGRVVLEPLAGGARAIVALRLLDGVGEGDAGEGTSHGCRASGQGMTRPSSAVIGTWRGSTCTRANHCRSAG